jgi:hypothetical protein
MGPMRPRWGGNVSHVTRNKKLESGEQLIEHT